MITVDCRRQANWLSLTLEALRHQGVAVVANVLPPDFLETTCLRMYQVQAAIQREVGEERLRRAGELGVLRLMLQYDPHFCRFLEIPELLAVVDRTVSETAILHLQNGFILPSSPVGSTPSVFQNRFHMDFPRVLNGCLMSVNLMFAIDAFTSANGGTLVVPGTHQEATPPRPGISPRRSRCRRMPAWCDAGLRFHTLARGRLQCLRGRSARHQSPIHALLRQTANRLCPFPRRRDRVGSTAANAAAARLVHARRH